MGGRLRTRICPLSTWETERIQAISPAEVCVVMPGQNSQSKLGPGQTQQMMRFAVRKPWENVNSITQEGLENVGLLPQTNVKLVRSFLSGKSIWERCGLT